MAGDKFEANNLFMKSGSKGERDPSVYNHVEIADVSTVFLEDDAFIEGKFFNGNVHLFGSEIKVLESHIPRHKFWADVITTGSEGQATKIISLSRDTKEVKDKVLVLFHETSPFYVEEPHRKKAKLRLGEVMVK